MKMLSQDECLLIIVHKRNFDVIFDDTPEHTHTLDQWQSKEWISPRESALKKTKLDVSADKS